MTSSLHAAELPWRSIAAMSVAMVCFSVSDVFATRLAAHVHPIQIGLVRYALLAATVVPFALRGAARWRSSQPSLQTVRALAIAASAVLMVGGLQQLPMAAATALAYSSPFFVTVLSILVLGEPVRRHRWIAVALGLVGVLLVARPGGEAFRWAALLPVLSAATWAVAMVATRRTREGDSLLTTQLYSATIGCAVLAALLPFAASAFQREDAASIALTACFWSAGQWLVVLAYRHAPASLLAPFSYTQLFWSQVFAVTLLGQSPNAGTLTGCAVILASGAYAGWHAMTAAAARPRPNPAATAEAES
jgi:drug/metabolite transporter (DMT)-like permease